MLKKKFAFSLATLKSSVKATKVIAALHIAAAFLFFSFSATASARACTEIGCMAGLTVELQTQDWPAGHYHFHIEADDKTVRCVGTLPFSACDAADSRCDAEGVVIGESGCALPKDAHHFYMIQLQAIPRQFSLTIEHDSGRKFHYSSAVAAQCGYPNGKECDKEMCCSATLTVPVKWE